MMKIIEYFRKTAIAQEFQGVQIFRKRNYYKVGNTYYTFLNMKFKPNVENYLLGFYVSFDL